MQGFAIGSAALVSLALFGAFVSCAEIVTVDVLSPKVFIGLIVGAMLPYWFSAMTMKSVGSAALKMVEEVRRQFNTIPGLMEGTTKPDYATCVKISTDASIKEMIPPGALVMLTPLIVGILFGVETLSGILAGALVSGVQVGTLFRDCFHCHNLFPCWHFSFVTNYVYSCSDCHLCIQHWRCLGQCKEIH
jgi:inorganic pyrophosphatase